MKSFTASTVALGFACVLLAGSAVLPRLGEGKRPVEGLADWLAPFDRIRQRNEELSRRSQALLRRITLKRNLASQVAAGDLSLLEAAAHFQKLDRQPPEMSWGQFRAAFPGRTDAERHCREVINFTRKLYPFDPEEGVAAGEHLESVLQGVLDQHAGVVVLPEVPDLE